MNVLFVADGSLAEPSSGTEQVLHHQALGLSGEGHRVFSLVRRCDNSSTSIKTIGTVKEAAFLCPGETACFFFSAIDHPASESPSPFDQWATYRCRYCTPALSPARAQDFGLIRRIPVVYVFHSPLAQRILSKN